MMDNPIEHDPMWNCSCGSGKTAYWVRDGYGIDLFKGCDDCYEEKLARYRPDIMDDYFDPLDAGEALEPEDYY